MAKQGIGAIKHEEARKKLGIRKGKLYGFDSIPDENWEKMFPKKPPCDHAFVGKDMLCTKCHKYFPETNKE